MRNYLCKGSPEKSKTENLTHIELAGLRLYNRLRDYRAYTLVMVTSLHLRVLDGHRGNARETGKLRVNASLAELPQHRGQNCLHCETESHFE